MRRDAPPFVFVDGDGDSNDDFSGITPSFLQVRKNKTKKVAPSFSKASEITKMSPSFNRAGQK